MSRESKLLKNTVIYALGNFGSKFIGFILLPIYTRYLNQSQMGNYDLIMTTVSLLLPFITLQINDAMYRYVLESKCDKQRQEYIDNSIIITIKGIMIFSILYIIIIFFLKIQYSNLILIQIITTVLSALFMQISRAYQKNIIYSISGIIMSLATLISTILFFVFTNFLIKGLIISNIIGASIVIIYIESKIKVLNKFSMNSMNKKLALKLLSYSIPLIPTGISWWVMNVSDRYILRYFLGSSANGIYAVANKFPSILMVINSLFYLAWQETSIVEYNSKDRDKFYSSMFNYYMIIQFTSVIVLIAFTKLILGVLVTKSFYIAWKYTPFLYIGAMMSAFSSFYGTGYQCSKKTKGAFITSVIGAISNIIINLIIIPYVGIQGAAISTAVSFLIMWIMRLTETKAYFNIRINKKVILVLCTALCIEVLAFFMDDFRVNLLIEILSVLIFIVYNLNLICKFKSIIRRKINAKTKA